MPTISRRRLVTYGLGGTVLLAAGGSLAWLAAGYHVVPGDAAIGLSVKELAVVRAIVEALLPADSTLPGGLELGIHQRIDEEIWSTDAELADDLRAAIQLIEHSPPMFGFIGRFSSLPTSDREACLRQMLVSGPAPVALAASALRQLAHLFYYCADQTWLAVSYDGPWVKQPRPPESAKLYTELLMAARGGL